MSQVQTPTSTPVFALDSSHHEDTVTPKIVICSPHVHDLVEPPLVNKAFLSYHSIFDSSQIPTFNNASEFRENQEPLKWPLRTEFKCSYHHNFFDSIPIPLPYAYVRDKNQYFIDPHLIFCSFSCALGYAIDHCHGTNHVIIYLNQMAREIFNIKQEIKRAHPLCLMKGYVGGYMSEQEWLQDSVIATVMLVRHPFVTYAMIAQKLSVNPVFDFEEGDTPPVQPQTIQPQTKSKIPTGQKNQISQPMSDYKSGLLNNLLASSKFDLNNMNNISGTSGTSDTMTAMTSTVTTPTTSKIVPVNASLLFGSAFKQKGLSETSSLSGSNSSSTKTSEGSESSYPLVSMYENYLSERKVNPAIPEVSASDMEKGGARKPKAKKTNDHINDGTSTTNMNGNNTNNGIISEATTSTSGAKPPSTPGFLSKFMKKKNKSSSNNANSSSHSSQTNTDSDNTSKLKLDHSNGPNNSNNSNTSDCQ